MPCLGTEHLCFSPGMGIAGGGQGCAQEPGTQPQPMPSSKCPFLGSSPVPFNNIPITSAAQRDLLQLGTLVLCMVTVPSMLAGHPHHHPVLALLQTLRKAQVIHGNREKIWHGTD